MGCTARMHTSCLYDSTPFRPPKTAFEAGFTTLALIGGEGLYCLYCAPLAYTTRRLFAPQKLLLRRGLQRSAELTAMGCTACTARLNRLHYSTPFRPQKTAFEAGFTTLALIGGEGLYCLYYPLPTSEVAAVNTPQNGFLRKTVFKVEWQVSTDTPAPSPHSLP